MGFHALFVRVAVVGCAGIMVLGSAISGCSKSSSASDAGSAATAPADLDQTLSGNPPADVVQAASAIAQALSASEQDHLDRINWSAATGESLIADPVFDRAFAAVESIPAASSVGTSTFSASVHTLSGDGIPCNVDCQKCQQELEAAVQDMINDIQARLGRFLTGGETSCLNIALNGEAPPLICAAMLLYLHFDELLKLLDAGFCMAGVGGSFTNDFGVGQISLTDYNNVAAANASCNGDGGSDAGDDAGPDAADATDAPEDTDDAGPDASDACLPPPCVPTNCAAQHAGCGQTGDGCGGALDCGTCPAGQFCGGGGYNQCGGGSGCSPLTCAQQGITCGLASDGCGGQLNCGECSPPLTCGGGGVPGQCGGC